MKTAGRQARDRRQGFRRRPAAARARSTTSFADLGLLAPALLRGEPIPKSGPFFPSSSTIPRRTIRGKARRSHDSLRPARRRRRGRAPAPPARPRRLPARSGSCRARWRASSSWRFFEKDAEKWFARETNTMPQWAGSCWYYLRFLDPKNDVEGVEPGRLRRVDAGRPLRRRRRARRPSPSLRALLAQSPLRRRAREGSRAVHEARPPGDDPRRGQREDVEVARQRRQPRRRGEGARRRRPPPLRDVHGAARSGEALADRADPGRGSLPRSLLRARPPASRRAISTRRRSAPSTRRSRR